MNIVKVSLLSIFLLLLTAELSLAAPKIKDIKEVERGEIDKITCDSTVEQTIHKGDTCNFYLNFSSEDAKVQISDVNFWFWSDEDYNGNDDIISFSPTKEIINAKWVVGNKPIRLITSSDYKIQMFPEKPSNENILIKYEILYNEILGNGKISPNKERYVMCARYRIVK